MISLVSLLAVGAITFVEQDIDAFGAFEYAAGHDSGLSPTFRHADLDGNGEPDLLLPTSVAFQRDGSFSRAGQTRLPAFIEVPKCDVWDSHLYFLFSDRMEVVRWAESGWQAILSQPVVWPVPLNEKSPGLPEDGANHSVEFDR